MSSEAETLPRAPDCWQLVPVEPTKDMIQASIWALDRWREKHGNVQGFVPPGEKYQIRWRAMLAAAPAAESDRLTALDASWRATLAKERAIHLNEVRLKDHFRTRALAAESELAQHRLLISEIVGILMPPDQLSHTWTGSIADAVRAHVGRLTKERDELLKPTGRRGV